MAEGLLRDNAEMSMPGSRMTAMASGRTLLGLVPALNPSKRSPAARRISGAENED
jgi:hypothetical protein